MLNGRTRREINHCEKCYHAAEEIISVVNPSGQLILINRRLFEILDDMQHKYLMRKFRNWHQTSSRRVVAINWMRIASTYEAYLYKCPLSGDRKNLFLWKCTFISSHRAAGSSAARRRRPTIIVRPNESRIQVSKASRRCWWSVDRYCWLVGCRQIVPLR